MKKIKEFISIYYITIKYWIMGDEWKSAIDYAKKIVKGWDNNG